jgi:hypothetical protein
MPPNLPTRCSAQVEELGDTDPPYAQEGMIDWFCLLFHCVGIDTAPVDTTTGTTTIMPHVYLLIAIDRYVMLWSSHWKRNSFLFDPCSPTSPGKNP